jgi:hypothetical protein
MSCSCKSPRLFRHGLLTIQTFHFDTLEPLNSAFIKLSYPEAAQLRSSEDSMNSAVYTSKVVYLPRELERFNALLDSSRAATNVSYLT